MKLALSLWDKSNLQRLVLLQKACSLIVVIVILTLVQQTNQAVNDLTRKSQHVYQISDDLFKQDEDVLKTSSDGIARLENFRKTLEKHAEKYFVVGRQYFFTNDDLPVELSIAKGIDDTELAKEFEAVFKSLQVGEGFDQHFDLKVIAGRSFQTSDYEFSINQPIPILIGHDFKKHLAVGSRISVEFHEYRHEAEIVGILNENSYFNNTFEIEMLDNTIIMPAYSLSALKKGKLELSPSQAFFIAISETNGYIVSGLSGQQLQIVINQEAENLNLIPYRISGGRTWPLRLWGAAGEELGKNLALTASLILLVAIVCTTTTLISRIIFLRKAIAIHIVNGYTYNEIYLLFIRQLLITNAFSLLLAIGVNYLLQGYFAIFESVILFLILFLWESGVIFYQLKQLSLVRAIREE